MKKALLIIILLLIESGFAAAGSLPESIAGEYSFTGKITNTAVNSFSLKRYDGGWWLEYAGYNLDAKAVACGVPCRLFDAENNDVIQLMHGMHSENNTKCLRNTTIAVCFVFNQSANLTGEVYFIELDTYPVQRILVKQKGYTRVRPTNDYRREPQQASGSQGPVRSKSGLQFDMGVWFGGDLVAVNPGGDNYNAGSGAVLGVAYVVDLAKEEGWKLDTSFGMRYQGAKVGQGSNEGIIIESSIVKEWDGFGVGAGLHYDFQNSVHDALGVETKFKDTLGTVVLVKYISRSGIEFVFKYLMADFESTGGRLYDGNQFGLFMKLPVKM
ncbi:MAG: hypothetical protein OEY07_00645 [Gammaproteobacteria bacterium]|nr:hypothetical protein [Gammaproteobacteria bacterium]